METEPCCKDLEDPAVELTEPEVREAISELSDRYSHTELSCGPAEEGDKLQRNKQDETESCPRQSTEIKIPASDPMQEGVETEYKERRKLKKTNSWKMVRFQDPSTDYKESERDSSAESLFPEYAMEAWTSSTFEELFMAEDWQDITGEDTSMNTESHLETAIFDLVSISNAA